MQNWWEQDSVAQPAPSAPTNGGIIRPRVDPYKARDQQLQEEAAQRARQDQARQIESDRVRNEKDRIQIEKDRARLDATGGIEASVEQGKAAGFALRAQSANADYESAFFNPKTGKGLDPDTLIGTTGALIAPGITANFSSDARNAQRSRERDFIAAVLRYESGAAIPDSEYATAYQIYFPSSNAGKEEIAAKQKARANAIEGLRLGAGPNVARIPGDGTRRPEMAGDVPVGATVAIGGNGGGDEPFDRNAYLATRGLDPNKEATIVSFWNTNRGNAELTEAGALRFYAEQGIPPPSADDLQRMIEQAKAGFQFGPVDTSQEEAAYRAELERASQAQGDTGYTERADQGITLGISDEAAGVGGAIGSLLRGDNPVTGYQFARDVQRFRNEQADQQTGLAGDAVEIGSSLFLPFGAARTAGQATRVGALAGGIGGFGYGEGTQNSLANAAIGSAAGGTLGYGFNRLGNAIANRSAANTQRLVQENDMLRAAEAVGTSPPARMFTDPSLEARTRATSQTVIGAQKIRDGVRQFGDEIEGAVNNLSTGTPIRNNQVGGALVREAAERQIKTTGASAKKSYDAAERLAGGAKVAPKESVKLLDEQIAQLSETSNLNKAEITFLQELRDDFSKDLSVGALRRARTTLRKKISKGDLVFGENEARVKSIMDVAADDITTGLREQGKGAAAEAFRRADVKYRARMEYIEKTLQKVIGKRNSNMSDEAILSKFRSLATPGGDSEGLRKFYASLTPEEAADVSATFAEMLGRGGKEGTRDFSTATLVENIEQLKKSGATMTTLFGKDGAKAINDIELLAREHKRVVGATSGGGSAAGNDWRFMVASMFFPGAGSAAASGGDVLMTGAAAALGFAIKAGRDALSARMLMSPKITNWARTAPKTTNPAVINKHFEKLGAIAKAEPALAAEIDAFRNAILGAANDNAQRAVAEDRQR